MTVFTFCPQVAPLQDCLERRLRQADSYWPTRCLHQRRHLGRQRGRHSSQGLGRPQHPLAWRRNRGTTSRYRNRQPGTNVERRLERDRCTSWIWNIQGVASRDCCSLAPVVASRDCCSLAPVIASRDRCSLVPVIASRDRCSSVPLWKGGSCTLIASWLS